jgi:hypothetical protein
VADAPNIASASASMTPCQRNRQSASRTGVPRAASTSRRANGSVHAVSRAASAAPKAASDIALHAPSFAFARARSHAYSEARYRHAASETDRPAM